MNNDTPNDVSLAKIQTKLDVDKGAEELDQIFKGVVPWAVGCESVEALLRETTIKEPEEVYTFLDAFYLFKIGEVSISTGDAEVAEVIYKRQQAVITAAYQAGYTLANIIVGNGGGNVDIFMGVKGVEPDTSEVFEQLVRGVYPGKGMIRKVELSRDADRVLRQRLKGKNFGGIITGIPSLKVNDEKLSFDLCSVIRSLYGKEYLLAVISRPVPKVNAANFIRQLLTLKDRCHALAKRTVGQDANSSLSGANAVADTKTVGETKTAGGSVSPTVSVSSFGAFSLTGTATYTVCGAPGGIGMQFSQGLSIGSTVGGAVTAGVGLSGNRQKSSTETSGKTDSVTSGWSKTVGESLTFEQQNGLAIELENIASKLIDRIRIGLNNGLWENFVTYAVNNETASKILSGALSGELIKGDPDALPVKTVRSKLPAELPLFIPKETVLGGDALSANRLSSYMSSTETALLMSPPLQAVPGYEICSKPMLSLSDNASEKGFDIGSISEHGEAVQNAPFSLSNNDIRKHIFVSGLTGSGKTTTVKSILLKANKPFLVIESAKREYRRLRAEKGFEGVKVYTVGDVNLSPIRLNPFWVMPNVSALSHIDNLKSTFNASFSLYGPMPYILERCLVNIYKQKGWDLTTGKYKYAALESVSDCRHYKHIYPTLKDLKAEVNRYVKTEMEYKGELQDNIRSAIVARIDSLCVGAKGFLFNTYEFLDVGELLQGKVILELESLADDDDKAFFVGLVLTLISEYRQSVTRNNALTDEDDLKHILVIEEAHRLLKNVQTERTNEMLGNPRGKAVESFCNSISEMRSMGQGIIVAEQIPTKIAPDVIKNTNTKIIHRLVSHDDQLAIGTSLGLSEEDARYLNQLSPGVALAHKEGMSRPVEIRITNELHNIPVDDRSIARAQTEDDAEAIRLYESGLLEDDKIFTIGLRMVNSFLLSGKEISELLEVAVPKVQVLTESRETDDTIKLALKKHFERVLFSQTMGLCSKAKLDKSVFDAYERLWSEKTYSRSRFISVFSACSGGDVESQMFRSLEVLLKKQVLDNRNLAIPEIIEKAFIINDRELQRRLIEKVSF